MSEAILKQEVWWHGVGVSDGVAAGRVLRLHGGGFSVYRATIDAAEVEEEINRLREAVRAAREQLILIKERAEREIGAEHAYIFDAHLLMLEDRKLNEEAETTIRRERVSAEWALKVVTDRLLAAYASIEDAYLRERGSDIEDVARRVLSLLSGAPSPHHRYMNEDSVVVAEELLPSIIAELDLTRVRAIVSDVGGWTSHLSIIARGLGIPAVVGTRDLYRHARTSDAVFVNATDGSAVLHPSARLLEESREAIEETFARRQQSSHTNVDDDSNSGRHEKIEEPSHDAAQSSDGVPHIVAPERTPTDLSVLPRTLDGQAVTLRANVELPAEFAGVGRAGAHGIGLYRSEFLWTHGNRTPSEDEQCAAYIEVARVAGDAGAIIRLFDLGGDKVGLNHVWEVERNPALGLRAIRLSLTHEEVLRTQARALLRAAAHGRIDIVLPMIGDVSDVRRARRIINEERVLLIQQGYAVGAPCVGAMIEVPSAVLTAESLARAVDFFSLGTNDLVQYLLAVDRGNDAVADWFRSLHPAVLHSIRRTIEAAREAGIEVVVCGEMASAPAYVFVLIGLGARDLSMTAGSINRVRRIVTNISAEHARDVAVACLACETADEVEELVRVRLSTELPHLFPPGTLPPPPSKS